MTTIIEIAALSNGAHRNQSGNFSRIPDGWAVIPENLTTENFPFGDVSVQEINGLLTVTRWIPGTIPEPAPRPESALEPTTEEILKTMLGVNRYE